MDGLSKLIPDLDYRIFMLKLSWQITEKDVAELKYVLTSRIPDGKKEYLTDALELFRYLERILYVGPDNLANLEELFRRMDKPKLCQMITTFIHDRNNRTVESSQIRNEDVEKTGILVSDPS